MLFGRTRQAVTCAFPISFTQRRTGTATCFMCIPMKVSPISVSYTHLKATVMRMARHQVVRLQPLMRRNALFSKFIISPLDGVTYGLMRHIAHLVY